jgi:trk system potassium uptake protein
LARYDTDAVAVIGLGRFGEGLARELMASGTEVLGIDNDERVVQRLAGSLTHVVVANSTDEAAMRQLGVPEFSRAVVGIGFNIEPSILTCSLLDSFGVADIWAKAISADHAKILTKIGCHHVVRPEHDTGRRLAHLISGRMLDYIEFDDGFVMVKMTAPAPVLGKTLTDLSLRSRFGVTIIGVKRATEPFTYADPGTVVGRGDLIIVSGARTAVEHFAELQGDD